MALGFIVHSYDGDRAFTESNGTNLEPEEGLHWPGAMLASAIRDLERMAAADAELVRLGEEVLQAWHAERDAVAATGDDDDITDLGQPVDALIERILRVQARTFAGIGVKAVAYAMIVDRPEESDTFDGRLYRGIHHDACALREARLEAGQ